MMFVTGVFHNMYSDGRCSLLFLSCSELSIYKLDKSPLFLPGEQVELAEGSGNIFPVWLPLGTWENKVFAHNNNNNNNKRKWRKEERGLSRIDKGIFLSFLSHISFTTSLSTGLTHPYILVFVFSLISTVDCSSHMLLIKQTEKHSSRHFTVPVSWETTFNLQWLVTSSASTAPDACRPHVQDNKVSSGTSQLPSGNFRPAFHIF